MNRRLLAACSGVPLALALGGVTLASAHGFGHGATGTVTNLTGTSLTVKLKNGTSVTDTLTSSTRVLLNAAGSLGDLKAGTSVTLSLASAGSTTVKAIHVQPTFTGTETQSTTGTGTHTFTGKPHTGTSTTPKPTTSTKTHVQLMAGGKIASVAGNSVTLTNRQGQSVIYTLESGATISKTVAGTLSDLKVGQTVSVGTMRGSTTALSVFIVQG